MEMKPLVGGKLSCLIGRMTKMGVASLCLSLPSGDHPEVYRNTYFQSTKWEINGKDQI